MGKQRSQWSHMAKVSSPLPMVTTLYLVYEDLVHQQDHDTQAWLLATTQVLLLRILVTKDLNCAEWSASKTENVQNERVKMKPTKCGEGIHSDIWRGTSFAHLCLRSLRNEAQDSKRTYQTAEDLLCVTVSGRRERMTLFHFDQKLQCRNMFVMWNKENQHFL